MAGTFKIRPTQLVQGGPYIEVNNNVPNGYIGWYNFTSPTEFDTLVQIVSTPANNPFKLLETSGVGLTAFSFYNTLRFSFFGNSIYLDGSSTPISFAGLPVGWTPLTATLNLHPNGVVFPPAAGQVHFFLQLDNFTEGSQDISSLSYNVVPSALGLISNGCGIRVILNVTSGGFGGIDIQEVVIEGTYTIVQGNQLQLSNQTVPVVPGDSVEFIITNSAAAGAPIQQPLPQGTLDGIEQIQLSYVDSSGNNQIILIDDDNNFSSMIIIAPNQLVFTLPIGFGSFSGIVTVTFVGNGIQFSGSVVAGFLNVLFENASGIYTLVNGQTDDILYFRAGYTTDTQLLFLPNIRDEELYYTDEDIFNSLAYPRKILAQSFLDEEDYEQEDYSLTSILRSIVVTEDVEVPSPFIKTAFLP